ncbi:hypothetical protein LCGC14_2966570 [marine sediment metagenome]|uniref:Uncharacterized protein n=1 Tax=marine sediment metagenome TaxID=412755 RepID=A0A0F9A1Y0_9ZZZZ
MAFGSDYQDFAPLPGGNLGSAQQSEIMHRKTKGKGPGLYMKIMEQIMNNTGILPSNVTFSYNEQDIESTQELARLRGIRAKTRAQMIDSGEINSEVARELAVQDGDITEEQKVFMDKAEEEFKREMEEQARLELTNRDDPDMGREITLPVDRISSREENKNSRQNKIRTDTAS